MIVVVCLQYSVSILTEIFVQSNIECVSSVRYFFCSIGFNLIYEYLFNGDVTSLSKQLEGPHLGW